MYVYLYIHIYICKYVCIHVYVYTYMEQRFSTISCRYLYVYTSIYICKCVCIRVYVYTCLCIYIIKRYVHMNVCVPTCFNLIFINELTFFIFIYICIQICSLNRARAIIVFAIINTQHTNTPHLLNPHTIRSTPQLFDRTSAIIIVAIINTFLYIYAYIYACIHAIDTYKCTWTHINVYGYI